MDSAFDIYGSENEIYKIKWKWQHTSKIDEHSFQLKHS